MRVTVQYHGFLGNNVGRRSDEFELEADATLEDTLRLAVEASPAVAQLLLLQDGGIAPWAHITVNAQRAHQPYSAVPLQPSDVVGIHPALAGG